MKYVISKFEKQVIGKRVNLPHTQWQYNEKELLENDT